MLLLALRTVRCRAFAKESAVHTRAPTPAEIRWRVVALRPPRALRACAGCGGIRPFTSSGCFRVNAQKRRLDVWLIYRCVHCDGTWNLEVVSRVRPDAVDPAALSRWHQNDEAAALAVAFDAPRLARAGARVEAVGECRVERPDGVWPAPHEGGPAVRVELATPCDLRLERLLASELGLSRAAIRRLVGAGQLRIEPGGAEALRRAPSDGVRIGKA